MSINVLWLQVFCLLVLEMGVFMGLIVPLPFAVRRKLFTFVSESPVIAKLQYGLRVGFSTIRFRVPDNNGYFR